MFYSKVSKDIKYRSESKYKKLVYIKHHLPRYPEVLVSFFSLLFFSNVCVDM